MKSKISDDFNVEQLAQEFCTDGPATHVEIRASIGISHYRSESLTRIAPDDRELFDIASLTKVVATWSLVGYAIAQQKLTLDTKLGFWFPDTPCREITIRQILQHSSGLMKSTFIERYGQDLSPIQYFNAISHEQLESTPGKNYEYINRGFILLTHVLQDIYKTSLDALFINLIAKPLGIKSTTFIPAHKNLAVPTEIRPGDTKPVTGEVHDENASLLGGVSGHAGLFSTSEDILKFGEAVNAALRGEKSPLLLSRDYISESMEGIFTHNEHDKRAVAWLTRETELGLMVFHYGFTGTALYLFPEQEACLVILTNSVHGTRDRQPITEFRSEVLDTFITTCSKQITP